MPTLYLTSTATASPYPTTSRTLSTSANASAVNLIPGWVNSGNPGGADAGQWNPSSGIAAGTQAAEINNNGGSTPTNTRQGWLYDVDLTGKKLNAGDWSVQLRLTAAAGSGQNGSLLMRVSIVSGSSGTYNTVKQIFTTTRVSGNQSLTAGQDGWRDNTQQITVTSSTANFTATIDGGTDHTFSSGERIFIELGFGNATGNTQRSWQLTYNDSNSFITTPNLGDVTSQTQTGNAVIAVRTTQTQSGEANVLATTSQTQSGNAQISLPPTTTDQTQSGNARVISTPNSVTALDYDATWKYWGETYTAASVTAGSFNSSQNYLAVGVFTDTGTLDINFDTASGDLLLLAIAIDKNGGTVSTPTGYTLIRETSVGTTSSGCSLALFYKFATGNENGTTINFTWATATRGHTAFIREFSGLSSKDVDQIASTTSGTSVAPNLTAASSTWGFAVATSDSGTSDSTRNWTNAFTTEQHWIFDPNDPDGPGGSPGISVAFGNVSGGSTTATYTANGTDERIGIFVTFNKSPGSGDALTAPDNDAGGDTWVETDYDDSGWASAGGVIGVDPDGGTSYSGTATYAKPSGITGSNPDRKTYYFRNTFNVPDATIITGIKLYMIVDDGCNVWINGVNVARYNMGGYIGDGAVTYDTLASSTISNPVETGPIAVSVPLAALVEGTNTIAMSVHSSVSSGDTDMHAGLKLVIEDLSSGTSQTIDGISIIGIRTTQTQSGTADIYEARAAQLSYVQFEIVGDGNETETVTYIFLMPGGVWGGEA
jgi:hypothetical protein